MSDPNLKLEILKNSDFIEAWWWLHICRRVYLFFSVRHTSTTGPYLLGYVLYGI